MIRHENECVSLTLGLPLERHIAGECVGGTRLHFMLHASF